MAYPISVKREAQDLRSRGYSYREISNRLKIGKGTAYAWTQDIPLSIEAEARLMSVMSHAQYQAAKTNRARRLKWVKEIKRRVSATLESIHPDRTFYKILAAILYWAEGGKHDRFTLKFTNSDPKMIATFMHSLRNGFDIDESKLRVLVHVHDYHDEPTLRRFWSKVSKIPLAQFNKSYHKPHTSKRKRNGYKGCICIMYFDTRIAEEVRMIYNKMPERLGVW